LPASFEDEFDYAFQIVPNVDRTDAERADTLAG
jgi:hypothetical protein